MSLKWTESWMSHAIGSYSATGTLTSSPGTDISPSVWVSAYNAMDWKFYNRGNGGSANFGVISLIADPVEASKQRMYLRSYRTNSSYWNTLAMVSAFTAPTAFFFGFLLRLKAVTSGGFVILNGWGGGTGAADTYGATQGTFLGFIKSGTADTDTWSIVSYSTGSAVTSSSMVLSSDVDHFIEVKADRTANTLRVWVDDLLVLDSTMTATFSAKLATGIVFQTGTVSGTAGTSTGIGAYLSDMYFIDATDTVAPYTRLGKTTRVRGEKPTSDYSVQMSLPDGYTNHYDVVDDQISSTAAPSVYLSAETAGTKDLFGTSSDATGYASAVHGVVIKSVSGNYGETSHTIGGVMSDGTTESVVNMATLAAASGWDAIMSVHPTAPDGTSWTPAKVAAAKFGVELVS